jgi:membrane associated rhomboid family serine protease
MAFLGAAVLVYLFTGFGARGGGIYEALAQSNQAVAAGEWWRLFTPILLHAQGIMHILFNMYALWILGPQIERGVGSLPFAAAYLASAGAGGAFFFFLGDPLVPAVGASGAIFGLFGIWFNWALRRRNTRYGRYLLNQILVLLVINAAIPFLIPGIAWEAHLGGLIGGFMIGEAWSRVRGPNQTVTRTVIAVAVGVLAVIGVLL